MAQHGGLGDTGGPRPALLEAQLPHKVQEVEGASRGQDLAHPGQVYVLADLLRDLPAGAVYAVQGTVGLVDEVELPS